MSERSDEDVVLRHRSTTEESRREGSGSPDSGIELPAPDATDESGTTDLGVDEPHLPESLETPPTNDGRT